MESVEKKLAEIRKSQPDIGVATATLNRLPVFEPTLRAKFQTRTFENQYGKLMIKGRLGQNHKSVLETILYKRKAFDLRRDEEGKPCLKVLYNEYEVRKYLSAGSTYSYERYKELIEDMIQAYIRLETEKITIEGTLMASKITSNIYSRKTKSTFPHLREKEIPYAVIEFGIVASILISQELKFSYDPKPIMSLRNGVSQALVRYIKTHKNHPPVGYHLRPLLENLIGEMENKKWWKIREYLREDAETLANESIGIKIDFKNDRVFVIKSK